MIEFICFGDKHPPEGVRHVVTEEAARKALTFMSQDLFEEGEGICVMETLANTPGLVADGMAKFREPTP